MQFTLNAKLELAHWNTIIVLCFK